MPYREDLHVADPFPPRLAQVERERCIEDAPDGRAASIGLGCLIIGSTSLRPLAPTERCAALAFVAAGVLVFGLWLRANRARIAIVTHDGVDIGVYRRGGFVEKIPSPTVEPCHRSGWDELRTFFSLGVGTLLSGAFFVVSIEMKDVGLALVCAGLLIACAGSLASYAWLRIRCSEQALWLMQPRAHAMWLRHRDVVKLRRL